MESTREWFLLLLIVFIPALKNLTDQLDAEEDQPQPGLS